MQCSICTRTVFSCISPIFAESPPSTPAPNQNGTDTAIVKCVRSEGGQRRFLGTRGDDQVGLTIVATFDPGVFVATVPRLDAFLVTTKSRQVRDEVGEA